MEMNAVEIRWVNTCLRGKLVRTYCLEMVMGVCGIEDKDS